jgi:predicted porin
MHTSVCEIEIGSIDALYHAETKKNIKASYLKTGQKGIGKLQVISTFYHFRSLMDTYVLKKRAKLDNLENSL